MAETISVRVLLFFFAFFGLRPLMFMLIEQPNRMHALALLAVSTFIAFAVGALLLADPLGDTLVAWFVITAIIALLWFVRWKRQDYERLRRGLRPVSREESSETPLE